MGQDELEQPAGSRPALVRAMGRWDLTAVGVNQVIGSGIFVMPATVAAVVGVAASPLPWIAAGVANALIVLCFAEAGTRFREAGGPYVYALAAFGPLAAFEVAWMMWVTRVVSQAALANAFALYVARFRIGTTSGVGQVLVIAFIIGALAAINLIGVRYGSWVINFFTVTKLAPLLLFLAVGLFYIEPGNFEGMLDISGRDLGAAVLMLMFAFGGYELITVPASESRSPRRDAPKALLLTIGIVCAVYVLVQLVAAGTLPGLAQSDTPLADSAEMFMGPAFGILIAIGGLLSIAGSNAGSMLAGPRLTYAMGEKGQLPGIFAHVHPRFRTPDVSILVFAGIAFGLALTGTFAELATLSAVARIVFYMATCAAVPVLRRKVAAPEGAFELPGGALVPALALIVSLAILGSAAWADVEAVRAGAGAVDLLGLPLIGGIIALLVGGVLYFIARSRS